MVFESAGYDSLFSFFLFEDVLQCFVSQVGSGIQGTHIHWALEAISTNDVNRYRNIATVNCSGLRFRTNVSSLLLRRNDTSCMLIADNTSSSNFLTFELIESMRGLSLEPMHYHNKSAFKTIESNTN